MTLKLLLNGEEKYYTVNFIKALALRKAYEMRPLFESIIDGKHIATPEELDQLITNIVIEAYGKQFTLNDFYNGIDSGEVWEVINQTVKYIANKISRNGEGESEPSPQHDARRND